METKASGKDIILAVLDNMRESCEPLLYETLAPSHFSVYLHRDDYSRLSTIFPKIREEGYKALDEELAKLNKFNKKSFSFRSRSKASKVSVASTNWSVNFYADENNELSVGDILIHSQLSLPNQIEYGVGTKTQRSETLHSGGETKRLRKIQIEEKPDNQPAFARLSYKGKDGKNCEYFMTSAEISVGRGGKTEFCDLLVEGPADVSRQHFYLRHDPQTKEFFIQDVSKFGTSVNGAKVNPKEWIRLDPISKIILADAITIEFTQL